ncbi:MAG: VanZ family protein [Sinobacteraceae bacterium]|nr:VanZ family protein [Nevskiaceae bacterium]
MLRTLVISVTVCRHNKMIGDSHTYADASRRIQAWLLAAWVLLVLSASLYPFNFDPERFAAAAADGFPGLHAWHSPSQRDLIVNLLVYIPIGLLLPLVLGPRRPAALRWLAAVAAGALLSITVEVLQHAIRARVPSLADWVLNVASAAAGAILALLFARLPLRPLATRLRRLNVNPALGLLLALWFAAHAAPFVPRLRPGRVRAAIDASLALSPSIGGIATWLAAYLVLSAVMRTLFRRETFWPLFGGAILLSLAARLLFVGQTLTPDELIAVALALPVIAYLRRRSHSSSRTPLFGIVCIALLVAGLAPFAFVAEPQSISWIPFGDLVDGRADDLYLSMLERLFVAIGVVWIAAGSALGIGLGTLLLLGLTTLVEFAQRWLPQRVPDTTDLTVMILAAILVRMAQRPAVTIRVQ